MSSRIDSGGSLTSSCLASSCLASSLEGFDLEVLSRFSLSPRGRLLGVIESENPESLVNEVEHTVTKLSALELAVCIYLIRFSQPITEAVSEVLVQAILALANRFASNDKCSYETWNQFRVHIAKRATPQQLSQFLQQGEKYSEDVFSETFVYETWNWLSEALALSELGFKKLIVEGGLERWFERTPFLTPDDCLASLLLAYYLCTPKALEKWDLRMLVGLSDCQKFMGSVMSKVTEKDALLLALVELFPEDEWHIIKHFTPELFKEFELLITQENEIEWEPSMCLHILDNPFVQTLRKVQCSVALLNKCVSIETSILFAICSRLVPLSSENPINLLKIFEVLQTKVWIFDAINLNDHLVSPSISYLEPVRKFLDGDVHVLTDALYSDSLNSHDEFYDIITLRFFKAVVRSVVFLSKINTQKENDFRTMNGLRIKTASIALLFFLYNSIKSEELRCKAYEELKNKLVPVKFTHCPDETKVCEIEKSCSTYLQYGNDIRIRKAALPLLGLSPRENSSTDETK